MGMSLAAHSVKADTTDVTVNSNAPVLAGPVTQAKTAADIVVTNESSQASVSVASASTATLAEKEHQQHTGIISQLRCSHDKKRLSS